MPIIEDLTISEDIRLIVWEISETINDLKTEDLLSKDSLKSVSYTHLTLPTICSV